jgi:serine/threonine protein kinase
VWSIGVITYILLSGLSPFLGDNDNETFSNITRGEFDFEDDAFEKISEDAKDFISSLIIKRKEYVISNLKHCILSKFLMLKPLTKMFFYTIPIEKDSPPCNASSTSG